MFPTQPPYFPYFYYFYTDPSLQNQQMSEPLNYQVPFPSEILPVRTTNDEVENQSNQENQKNSQSKKRKYKPKDPEVKKNFNKSFWSLDENKKYCIFLRRHYEIFDLSYEDKKSMKINLMMSEYVKSRTAEQCRSHHQKMIKFHGTIENIIYHIKWLASKRIISQQEKTEEGKATAIPEKIGQEELSELKFERKQEDIFQENYDRQANQSQE